MQLNPRYCAIFPTRIYTESVMAVIAALKERGIISRGWHRHSKENASDGSNMNV